MHLSQCLLGLNPHSDTPVEILHVILLGIVKYFWRDAVSRLNPSQQEVLIIRLNSLDLSGLDPAIGSLSGETLVKYAGSLVGRDFRIIAQIAVFVLYDLLPSKIIRAWAALAAMMPLVWMAKIQNKTAYFVSSIAVTQGYCADVLVEAIGACSLSSPQMHNGMVPTMVQQDKIPFSQPSAGPYQAVWSSHSLCY